MQLHGGGGGKGVFYLCVCVHADSSSSTESHTLLCFRKVTSTNMTLLLRPVLNLDQLVLCQLLSYCVFHLNGCVLSAL